MDAGGRLRGPAEHAGARRACCSARPSVGFALLTRRGRDRRFLGSATDVVFGTDESAGTTSGARSAATTRSSSSSCRPTACGPGQVGTLIDEQANTLDVTATIIDLAVRGYLRITEIPKQGWLGSTGLAARLAQARHRPEALREHAAHRALRRGPVGPAVLAQEHVRHAPQGGRERSCTRT